MTMMMMMMTFWQPEGNETTSYYYEQAWRAPGRSWPRVRWILLSGQNAFKNHWFWAPRRPGVTPLRDPVPKFLHFFWKGFRTRACTDFLGKLTQERLFLQRQKSEYKRSFRVRGMGPPQGPAFACTVTTINKTNNKKLKKRTRFVKILKLSNMLRFHSAHQNVW